jgi:hypothetical protein
MAEKKKKEDEVITLGNDDFSAADGWRKIS